MCVSYNPRRLKSFDPQKHNYCASTIPPGQSFPTPSELLTTAGHPIPPLDPNSPIPTDTIFQWIFPSLTFEGGLNVTGWLFQGEPASSTLDTDDNANLFTIWQGVLGPEEVPSVNYIRRELNDTRASLIRKIEGTSPPLYYYELARTYVTRPGDLFGLRRTNQTLGIHFTIISGMSNGLVQQGDDSVVRCSFSCNNAGVTAQPLVIPVYGKLAQTALYTFA